MQKYYITFGQAHIHKLGNAVLNKDTVAVIVEASEEAAQQKAFQLFKMQWNLLYEYVPDMSYFPDGLVEIDL